MADRKPGPNPSQDAGDATSITRELDANGGTFARRESQFDTVYHKMNEKQLNQIVEDSHADHRDSTGQVPKDDGYKTYVHKGPYAKPSEE